MNSNQVLNFTAQAVGVGSPTQRCHNLRPVGKPLQIAPPGHRPLMLFTDDSGQWLLTAVGCDLYLIAGDGSGTPRFLHTLAYTPRCAARSDSTIHVATDRGYESIDYEAGKVLDNTPPAISLQAVPGPRTLRADVARRTLQSDYRQESALSAGDVRAVTGDLRAAYSALAREADAQAVMMQPALARYELLDAQGRTLFESPVLLLGTSQCAKAVNLTVGSDCSLPAYSVQATSWRPQIRVPSRLGGAHSVRVYLSPQFQPVDPSLEASAGLSHTASATTVGVVMSPSGIALDALNASGSTHTLLEAVGRFGSMARCVATVPLVADTVIELPCGPGMQPAAEISAVRKALAKPVALADAALGALRPPHSFTAAHAACSGHTVAWADITASRYGGYPLGMFAAATDAARAWNAFVAVDFADGQRVVWHGSGRSHAPTAVNPLLSYPAVDATAITVGVRVDGLGTAVRTVALAPLPGAAAAVGVDSSFAPVPLAFDSAAPALQVPQATASRRRFPGMIVAADAATPFAAEAAVQLGGRVHRVLPAAGSTGAWDFGRTRFCAFGTDGIHLATLNAARDRMATARVSGRSIASPQAVAQAEGCIYAASGGDILRVDGNRVRTAVRGAGCDALVWNPAMRELWTFAAGGDTARVYSTDLPDMPSHTRDAECAAELLGDENGAYMLDSRGLHALHSEERLVADMEWSARFDLGARRRVLRALVGLACGDAALEVAVSAAGTHHAEPVPSRTLRVSGPLLQALPVALPVRPLRQLGLRVKGSVHPDFQLKDIDLICRPQ